MTIRSLLRALAFTLILASPALAAKDDQTEWHLNVRFINGSKDVPHDIVQSRIATWVANAERLYRKRPALKISYQLFQEDRRGGEELSRLTFDSHAEYAAFMDQHFDNVAVSRTEGYMVVLITDQLCIGRTRTETGRRKLDCDVAGIAHFPHSVNPFSRKRGITMEAGAGLEYVLAHELGHVFGIKHTFEPYVGLKRSCNTEYKPKGQPDGYCNSCANGKIDYSADGDPQECYGPSNVMDYCFTHTGDEFLNPCQEERAAEQRKTYMTKDGRTNYFKLKGVLGTPICTSDEECDEDRYCDKGVATVGRNQCLRLKEIGEGCTRPGQCDTGRCYLAKCKPEDDCSGDRDCADGEYCDKGWLTVGINQCERKKSEGDACGRKEQCKSRCCKFMPLKFRSECRPAEKCD